MTEICQRVAIPLITMFCMSAKLGSSSLNISVDVRFGNTRWIRESDPKRKL